MKELPSSTILADTQSAMSVCSSIAILVRSAGFYHFEITFTHRAAELCVYADSLDEVEEISYIMESNSSRDWFVVRRQLFKVNEVPKYAVTLINSQIFKG